MDVRPTPKEIGQRLQAWRERVGWGQEQLADEIKKRGPRELRRPSAAKLSRIESGQPVPTDILPVLSKITGIHTAELRPDLAALFARPRPSKRVA